MTDGWKQLESILSDRGTDIPTGYILKKRIASSFLLAMTTHHHGRGAWADVFGLDLFGSFWVKPKGTKQKKLIFAPAKNLNILTMKKALFIAAAAAMLFAACGNNNTKTNTQQAQNEPAVEEPIVEEPAAPETTNWDHYDWHMNLPTEGWKVSNAYSEMGIEYLEDWSDFNIKDWTEEDYDQFLTKYPAGDYLEDIVIGDYTWKVIPNIGKYKLSFFTYNPDRKLAVRVGSEDIDDPTDERVQTVLRGFGFN